MRTYQGKYVNEADIATNGFFASVCEEGFDVDSRLVSVALSDERRYYPEAEDYDDAQGEIAVAEAPVVGLKYIPSPTFAQKMLRADEVIQDRYDELKNYALRFKKLKSRISKKFDSINSGRTQFVKFGLAGKTLKVYVNLKLEDTDPKFHCKDQSFKKPYVQVPVLIRVKSGRAVKYAKRLIAQSAEYCELKPNKKYLPKDYILEVEEMYNAGLTNGEALENEAAATEEE